MKLTPKVILEGTRLTGKTDLAFALNEHPRLVGHRRYRYHSPLISGEWSGFSNEPWGRGLIDFAPEETAHAMETYETWVRMFELQRYYSWIVDRFHLSTLAYQARQGREFDFAWLEERLKPLNFAIVLCTRPEDTFEAAREERLRISANPKQYVSLEPFVEEQHQLRALAAKSILPVLELDVTRQGPDDVARWLDERGLLTL
ncbi:hypothetical protein SAMN04488074_103272 [Lentzea albidocapillata subsp. violacea]|uniref:Uncharacterized protein n=1 Tax=Lentzea albidocapillata subsp. violacea TaxID=128104 RepID=A0A1G8WR40_9PSEU|nr:hypothetical protein [Lentzea albidocapillata]SDJ80828.1 hypothetical protein SAMN04488074_103272 [Lentzea albidocapillata subsp. violacea]